MTTHVDDSLYDLALGTLESAERVRAEEHLAVCARCAAELDAVREVLAALPLALPPNPPPPALRERLLRTVAGQGRFAAFTDRVAALLDVAAERARAMLDELADPARWAPGFSAGMDLIHVHGGPCVANAITGFVRMPPGCRFPPHRHVGTEQVLVLQGSYRDSDGSVHHAGESLSMPPGSEHSFAALPGEDLMYLAVIGEGLEVNGELLSPSDPRA